MACQNIVRLWACRFLRPLRRIWDQNGFRSHNLSHTLESMQLKQRFPYKVLGFTEDHLLREVKVFWRKINGKWLLLYGSFLRVNIPERSLSSLHSNAAAQHCDLDHATQIWTPIGLPGFPITAPLCSFPIWPRLTRFYHQTKRKGKLINQDSLSTS